LLHPIHAGGSNRHTIGYWAFDQSLQIGNCWILRNTESHSMVMTDTFNGVKPPSISSAGKDEWWRW
jgi:hypothetical protein